MAKVTTLYPAADGTARFVRVTDPDHNGFVEFQFSVGDPDLYLEMTLPPKAFRAFCEEQQARILSDDEARAVDRAERRWRFGDEEDVES